jgi:uncharacterized RDD family membrane protein YckC
LLSPEKTILSYRLAGIGGRAIAQLVDCLVLFIIGLIILLICTALGIIIGSGMITVTFSALASVLLFFLYFILQEGLWNGLTLGKKICGLRVRMVDGTPITIFAAITRNFLRIGDFLPSCYFAGFIAVISNPRSQRLGDLAAGTVVVYERRPDVVYTPAPHAAGTHYYEEAVGNLKGMTIEEYVALRRLCDRLPELPPQIQTRMLAEIWIPIARRRNVPEYPTIHPLYLAEAAVMKFGRQHGLL